MDVVQFLRTLYRYLPLIILLPVVTVLITYIFVRNMEGEYRARSVISSGIIESQSGPGSDARINRDQIAFRYANFMELINSRPVISLVSFSLLRHDLQNPGRGFRTDTPEFTTLSPERRAALIDSLTFYIDTAEPLDLTQGYGQTVFELLSAKGYDPASIANRTRIQRLGQSDYIQILVETENPRLSAYIANELADLFIRFYRHRQNQLLGVNIDFYLEQVRLREIQLDERSRRLQNFKVANSITNLYEQTKAIAVQISDFEYLRQMETRTFRGAQSLIDSLDVVLRDNSGRDFTEGRQAALNAQVAAARRQMSELNRRRVNAVIRGEMGLADQLEQEVNEIRDLLHVSVANMNNQAIADPRVAREQLITQRMLLALDKEQARQALLNIERELQRLANLTREFARLEAIQDTYVREIDLAERDYLSMLDRLNQFRLTQQQTINSGAQVEQIERAMPPRDPLPSKKILIILVAGAGSFGFALVSVFIIEYFDLTIKTARQLANTLEKPVFGIIPGLEDDELDIPAMFAQSSSNLTIKATLSLVRHLRSNIIPYTEGRRIIISSTQPKTGKTFLSILISYALAQTGRKVLLVDANMLSNKLTQTFQSEPVLEKYLTGEIDLQEAITPTSHDNIFVLGCGISNFTINEIATKARLEEAFDRMIEGFDSVIIDSTMLVKHNNTRELLPFADSIILAFAAGEVVNGLDRELIGELNEAPISFEGCILNKVELNQIEDVYGELNKKRSYPRRVIKQIIRGNIKGAFRFRQPSDKID